MMMIPWSGMFIKELTRLRSNILPVVERNLFLSRESLMQERLQVKNQELNLIMIRKESFKRNPLLRTKATKIYKRQCNVFSSSFVGGKTEAETFNPNFQGI